MNRYLITPILWGFFLSTSIFASQTIIQPRITPPRTATLASPTTLAVTDTLHVLAIRVEFQTDTLSTTTGDGSFESGIPDDIVADPLPHDKAYFEDHITFLKNYFGEISGGKVHIEDDFRVYPNEPDSAYLLPHQMWHYNYNSGIQEDLDRSLAELFRDAWTAAAEDPALDPTGYDLFIIFHAGVGQDFEVGYDETPHDIPSAYFRLSDLQEALDDPAFPGVEINGTFITGGMLLPESERQSEADVEIAMNGTAALLFGHWLGLPALYNTDTGSSGVGRFDFMDQGSGNFAGMVPSRPCAWTRSFMGWEEPVRIVPDAVADTFSVKLAMSDSTYPEIYRIDLNESEYYLIENRSGDPEEQGYTIARDSQGRRLKIYDNFDVEVMDGDFGVIVEVDNYDFGLAALPDGNGEGILIWHIDDRIIEANYSANSVNNDISHLGVAILEADGSQDIGREFGILAMQDLGWWGDFFFGGNEPFLYANPNQSTVRIFDSSNPSTRAYDGSSTGLVIGGFSSPGEVMQFWVSNNWGREGFPRQLADPSMDLSPSALDFDADGQTDWILTVTPEGAIQAFDTLGLAQGSVYETRLDTNLLGEVISIEDTLLARVDAISATPAISVQEDYFKAFFPGGAGTIYTLEYNYATEIVDLDTFFIYDNIGGTPLIAGIDPLHDLIYIPFTKSVSFFQGLGGNREEFIPNQEHDIVGICQVTPWLCIVFSNGIATLVHPLIDSSPKWVVELPFAPTFSPLTLVHNDSLDRTDIAAVSGAGDIVLIDPETGSIRAGFPLHVGMSVTAPPAAADFDGDGYLEVVLVGENRIAVVQVNGTLAPNWQNTVDNRRPFEPILSPPTISELDGELRVLFGWSDGSVDARNAFGEAPGMFPLTTGGTVRSTPLVVQLDADVTDESELVVLDDNGTLFVRNLEQLGSFDEQSRPWNGLFGGNFRQGVAVVDTSSSVETYSGRLLNIEKVYPWPNPAKQICHIRYQLGQSGRISARIFDGSGDLVKEISRSADQGLEGDLIWDLADVSSGVYIGRIEAESGGKTETAFIKIAVVK